MKTPKKTKKSATVKPKITLQSKLFIASLLQYEKAKERPTSVYQLTYNDEVVCESARRIELVETTLAELKRFVEADKPGYYGHWMWTYFMHGSAPYVLESLLKGEKWYGCEGSNSIFYSGFGLSNSAALEALGRHFDNKN